MYKPMIHIGTPADELSIQMLHIQGFVGPSVEAFHLHALQAAESSGFLDLLFHAHAYLHRGAKSFKNKLKEVERDVRFFGVGASSKVALPQHGILAAFDTVTIDEPEFWLALEKFDTSTDFVGHTPNDQTIKRFQARPSPDAPFSHDIAHWLVAYPGAIQVMSDIQARPEHLSWGANLTPYVALAEALKRAAVEVEVGSVCSSQATASHREARRV